MIGVEGTVLAVISGGASIAVAVLYSRHINRKDTEQLQNAIDDCRIKITNIKHFRLPECEDDKKNIEKDQAEVSRQIIKMQEDSGRVEKLIIQAIGEEITDRKINAAEHIEFRGIMSTVSCEMEKAKARLEKAESKITDNKFSAQQDISENTRDINSLQLLWKEQKEDIQSIKDMVTGIFNHFIKNKK